MYDFLINPLFPISVLVFLGGLAFRTYQFFSMTQEKKVDPELLARVFNTPKTKKESIIKVDSASDVFLKWRVRFKHTMFGRTPVFTSTTIIFHVLLFFLPLFAIAHNTLLDQYFGFTLWTIPETLLDLLTCAVISILLFFLYRRVFVAKVRSVTTYRDFLAWSIAAAPFITGFLAYHQYFDYYFIVNLHIFCGEVMLMAIPFTKLVHMPMMVLFRSFIRNEMSFGFGTRTWATSPSY